MIALSCRWRMRLAEGTPGMKGGVQRDPTPPFSCFLAAPFQQQQFRDSRAR
jgi:hypothetical protein